MAATFYDVDPAAMTNPNRRNGRISKARWAVAHALVNYAHWNNGAAAVELKQDHSAITYALRRASELRQTDELFWDLTKRLYREVHS